MRQPLRSIPVAELAEGEPTEGGRYFHDAADEWGELRSDWTERAGIPLDEPVLTELFVREQHNWLIQDFTDRWFGDEFVAFGYPLHDAGAMKRVRVPSALCNRLLFDKRGDARDDLVWRPIVHDAGLLKPVRRKDGVPTRRFREVLFYRRARAASATPGKGAETHSGMPGRPTARHIYEAELRRRYAEGRMLPSVEQEARALCEWFVRAHPALSAGKLRSVANNIRALYRELSATRPERDR